MNRARTGRACIAILLGLAMTSGCAAIPDSSTPIKLDQVVEGGRASEPEPPASSLSATELARSFLAESVDPDDDHRAARLHLTEEAAEAWNSGVSIHFLGGNYNAIDAPDQVVSPDSQDTAVVEVSGWEVGVLNEYNAYEPRSQEVEFRLPMRWTDDGWRITEAPPGVIMPIDDFRDHYQPVQLYFFAHDRKGLVPERRYLPPATNSSQPGQIVELLKKGPSPALQGAVHPVLSAGVDTRHAVAENEDGVIEIDLTNLGELTQDGRREMVAGLVFSLQSLRPTPVRVLVEGVDILPDQTEWHREDFDDLRRAVAPNPDLSSLVVRDGQVQKLTVDGEAVPGPAGDGTYHARSASQSITGSRLAVVGDDAVGGRDLWVGEYGEELSPVPVEATTLTRPTWRAGASELWTVADGRTVLQVVATGEGGWQATEVSARELHEYGEVTALRFAPDGMRVVAIANGRLLVGAIVSDGGNPRIGNLRELPLPRSPQATAVSWNSPSVDSLDGDLLVVATDNPDAPVVRLQEDGLDGRTYQPTNLSPPVTEVTAFPGQDVIVADQNGLWTSADVNGYWKQLLRVSGSSVTPSYPG
ncbi:hypothetical protein FHR81_004148 [Actinoalloteichus hoggarensis]|uniref:Lipoprotein LpqB n=1 Tax=Actinoalloteichus hoggarensis TaxID=1470176 RepID=A0A221W9H0_9PSEU|nr:LpqB family beta-propeller domain-containing protein [Actinoalloteichus hoggarensis]ASO22495.1 Lipoprotein LpqB precursor [Actinoalloteichus hoggarensis]MBB5923081.1 hypothetical protein [Actinoalloteichus hoggarensis]